jgi:hypothetical protein
MGAAPYRDGTTHVMIEPLDFPARLGVLTASNLRVTLNM